MKLEAPLLAGFVRSALKKAADGTRFLGLRTDVLPDGEQEIDVDGAAWRVVPVRSTLQARRALVQASAGGRCLLLTPLGAGELGEEVVARLGLRRLESIQPWQLVREAFQAHALDPRVTRQAWMADVLLAHRPAQGYPAAPSAVLDLDTAWRSLAPLAGLPSSRPSLGELLGASADGALGARWGALAPEFREAVAARLGDTLGGLGRACAALLDVGQGDALVPIAIVAELCIAPQVPDKARVVLQTRLEEQLGFPRGQEELLAPLAAEARRWCRERGRRSGLEAVRTVLHRADELVERLAASGSVEASSILPSGLAARRRRLARALARALDDLAAKERRDEVEDALRCVEEHLVVALDAARDAGVERARNAVRLVRWLATPEPGLASLAERAAHYRDAGAWVDRARHGLVRGEADAELSDAYQLVTRHARERRERESCAFAERLAAVVARSEGGGDLLPLERLLIEVVAPLAVRAKVLVVVLDGMSLAIFQQLAEDLERRRTLQRMAPAEQPSWRPTLALLPTVTEVCRTSLFCGRATVGAQAEEIGGLEDLAQAHGWRRSTKSMPLLFHKAALRSDGGGLSADLRDAIGSTLKVVAVVLNAIDDQLPKGDQLRPSWSLDTLPELEALVTQAENERRVVVLTADHGHVVDLGANEKVASAASSGRWRAAGGALVDGEIEVRGARVLLPRAGGPVVLPWSEGIRYSARHAGYHGGASPQEVVVPLGVFVPANLADDLEGWAAEVVLRPTWWDGAADVSVAPLRATAPAKSRAPAKQPELFPERDVVERPAWLSALFDSQVYAGQKTLAGRKPPSEEEVAELLGPVATAGGTLTFDGLRNRTRLTDRRLRLLLTAVQRLLNVDGYAVFEVDLAGRSVRLDVALLVRQFGIAEDRGGRR